MGLSQALATAISGLRTTQAGMSLVAANVANAQTPGYVRKTLSQVTTAAGGTGVSVRVDAVTRELDQYIQRQLQTETSGASFSELRARFYTQLQQIYGDPSSDTSLESVFNSFTNSLQALSANPSDFSSRTAVLSAAQILTSQLNGMTDQIQALRSDAERGLADVTATANNALTQIASINRQLATGGSADATAATLADQRDYYITQLSQILDIRVIEGDRNQVSVFTGSGVQIVGTQAAQFSFNEQGTVTPNALYNSDPTKSNVGALKLILPTGASYDLIANKGIRSGQMAAYLDMRDNVLVEAQTQLDAFAAALADSLSSVTTTGSTVSSPPQAGVDLDISNLQDGNSFQFSYTDVLTGKVHNVSVVRVDDPKALPLPASATVDPNDEVIGLDFSGGTAGIANQLNAIYSGKLSFSDTGTALRILDNGTIGTIAVNGATATRTAGSLSGGGPELPFFDDASKPYTGEITESGSQIVGFAGRISVNLSLLADPSKLVAMSATTSSGDPTRPNFIYEQLMTASHAFSPDTGIGTAAAPFDGKITSYLRQVLSQQGQAAQNADSINQGQQVVYNSLAQRFKDVSGVSVDQEMANLLNLQNAYGANARIMTTVREMYQELMQVL
ncbi:MAG: flagellar hook-associated protein FlgK [Xanthobacteraceae bacterium]|uniref:flagellar hook-associated protein FlgK n=1 Tax=Pseudolabrys sp. TaxID=1960880 RepID=UPI003D09AF6A